MRIELMVMPGCPHTVAAALALEEAMKQAGVGGASVTVTVVSSDEQARARGFVGSPTFLIDGQDPFGTLGALPALACRMYSSGSGLSGVPEVDELRDALLRASTGRASAAGDQ